MNKNIMKKAHEMTREIVEKYGDVDYKTQFSLCLSFLSENKEEKQMNYEVLAINSKLNMTVSVEAQDGELIVTKVVGKEVIFERTDDNKYDAKLDIISNKFCLVLKNKAMKTFMKQANIKAKVKEAKVVIKADDLLKAMNDTKESYLKAQEEAEQKRLNEIRARLNDETIIVIDRYFSELTAKGEFAELKEVKELVKKVKINESTFETLQAHKTDERKTDCCFYEKYELPFAVLKDLAALTVEKVEVKETHFDKMLKKAQETNEKQVLRIQTIETDSMNYVRIVTYVFPDGHTETH